MSRLEVTPINAAAAAYNEAAAAAKKTTQAVFEAVEGRPFICIAGEGATLEVYFVNLTPPEIIARLEQLAAQVRRGDFGHWARNK